MCMPEWLRVCVCLWRAMSVARFVKHTKTFLYPWLPAVYDILKGGVSMCTRVYLYICVYKYVCVFR